MSDAELIPRLLAGDERAYNEVREIILEHLRRRCPDFERDHEEICQEVLIKINNKLREGTLPESVRKSDRKLKGYIRETAHTTAISYHRKNYKEKLYQELSKASSAEEYARASKEFVEDVRDDLAEDVVGAALADESSKKWLKEVLHEAIERLPQLRKEIMKKILEYKTNEEIAAELGVSNGVVRGQRHHGRAQLKKILSRRADYNEIIENLKSLALPPPIEQEIMRRIPEEVMRRIPEKVMRRISNDPLNFAPTTSEPGVPWILITIKPAVPWIIVVASLAGAIALYVKFGTRQIALPDSSRVHESAMELKIYPRITKKPPLKVPQVNQNSGGGASDLVQKTAADSQNDIEWDKGSWTQTKGPSGGIITALHPTLDGSLLAGTLLGGISRLTDNGERWVHASEGLGISPSAINAFAQKGNTVYVGTYAGLFYSTNNSESWQQLADGKISGVTVIGDTIYIARLGGSVLFSNDNGESWTPFDTGLPDLDYAERLTLFASGTTLFAQTQERVRTIKIREGPQSQIIFRGTPRRVFRVKVGEKSWKKLTIKENTVESDIMKFIVSGEIAYAVTASGGLFRSTDMGDSWQRKTPEAMQNSNGDFTAVGNTVFYINLVDGRVFQSEDAGDSWTMFNANLTNQRILSIAAVSEDTLYVGTPNGVVKSTDSGKLWTKATTGIPDKNIGEIVSLGKTLLTVTGDGISKLVDGGDSWGAVNEGLIPNDLGGVAGSEGLLLWDGAKLTVSGDNLFVATCKSNTSRWNTAAPGIYRLAEDGKSLLPILNIPAFPESIDVIDGFAVSGETYYIISRKRIYRGRVGEDRWKDMGLRVWHPKGFAVSDRTVCVQTEDGEIMRSMNEGDKWTAVNPLPMSNVGVPAPEDSIQWRFDSQTGSPLCNLYLVGETKYGVGETIYANDLNNVFLSTNGGRTWRLAIAGLPEGKIKIQLVDGTTIFGTNSDGVFRLTLGSDKWEKVAPIQHTVVSLAYDGTTLYINTGKNGIYRFLRSE